MIPRELLKKIRHIEVRTSHLAHEMLAGAYHSVFKGRGMDFEEVREYELGDDIRTIDWNVTARTGVPHIKKYREERDLTLMVMVDVSASGQFGSGSQTKRELAAEIASIFAFSAARNGDKVGLVLFTDEVETFIPPRKGRSHIFRIIREILACKPARKGTNLKTALDFLNSVMRRPSVVFLISDFLDEGFEKTLRVTNRRHDVVAVSIYDRRELELPDVGTITLEDTETGEIMEVNLSEKRLRESFSREAQEERKARKKRLERAGLDTIELETEEPYQNRIRDFFERRLRRVIGSC